MWVERYEETIEEASQILVRRMMRDAEDLIAEGRRLDVIVRTIVLAVGQLMVAMLFRGLGEQLVEQLRDTTPLHIERSDVVSFKTLLGEVAVWSPYLYDDETKESARPMRENFGVVGKRYSDAMDRALSDFGAETSYADAAARFEEHYGMEVGRTVVRNRTMKVAEAAREYVEERLSASANHYDDPEAIRPTVDVLFGEADGCMIRCGELMTAAEARAQCDDEDELARIADRGDDELVRLQKFREVRTGLMNREGEVEPTYVSLRGSWSQVAEQLFGVACEKGLGFSTQVVFAGDGGNGIKESMEMSFANLQYILDRPHLKNHVRETGDCLDDWRDNPLDEWVDDKMHRIDEGHVGHVLAEFEGLLPTIPPPPDDEDEPELTAWGRLNRLVKYLKRFYECVDYGTYAANDWPMGSGRAESSHKSIPQLRLKRPGACWREENLTPMCAVRVVQSNGWWGDFWNWETERRSAA